MLNTLFLASFFGMALGSVLLWMVGLKRLRNQTPLLGVRQRLPSPFGLMDISIMFVTWFIGQVASMSIAVLVLGIETDQAADTLDFTSQQMAWLALMVGAGQLISTGIGLAIIWSRYLDWEVFGFRPELIGRDTGIGILAFVMVIPAVLLIQLALSKWMPYEHPTHDMLTSDHSLLMIIATWFSAVLVAPICEEIFFRGFLQGWLQRLGSKDALMDVAIAGGWSDVSFQKDGERKKVGERKKDGEKIELAKSLPSANLESSEDLNPFKSSVQELDGSVSYQRRLPRVIPEWACRNSGMAWVPIVISAALFGLAHIGQGAAPIPLFVFGIALGFLYRQTGSIWTCIVLHMGLNGFSMFWFTLQVLFPDAAAVPGAELSK